MFALEDELKKLFDGKAKETRNTCHRDHIHGDPADWIDGKPGLPAARYSCRRPSWCAWSRRSARPKILQYAPDIGVSTDPGKRLIQRVMNEFQVSQDAARVRLEQRKAVVPNPVAGLFG